MWYNVHMRNHSFILQAVLLCALCANGDYIGRPAANHAAQLRRHTGIPSLAVSPVNGRLWATYYGGITPGEDSNNYLVLATSGDGGCSWRQVLVADPDGAGPRRVFDAELWVAPDGKLRWTFTDRVAKPAPPPEQYAKAYAGDEGDPKTDRLMCVELDAENEPEAPFPQPCTIARGVMMCKPAILGDGTWLLPVSHWGGAPSACFYASTDGGKTFSLRGGATLPKGCRLFDEHVVTELRNGDLLTFIRAAWDKPFQESVSHDGGRTWETPRAARFTHTSSRIFLKRLASGNLLLVKNGSFDKDEGRSRLTAFLSEDDGATWGNGLLLDERNGVSYPDGDQAKDGTIYVIYDHDRLGAQEILFAAFTEADVRAGRVVDARARLRQLVERKPPSCAARVAKTVRPDATGFCFNPDFHTYEPFKKRMTMQPMT